MTTEKAPEMPALPATHIMLLSDLQSGSEPGFNAHHMRAYGAECARMAREEERERCAKLCDALASADDTCRGDLPNLRQFASAIRNGE